MKASCSVYIDDMGSLQTNANDWDDLLWNVNSARDHDSLPHITMEQLKRSRPKINGHLK